LQPPAEWLHWSIPDPVEAGSSEAFDAAVADLYQRISAIADHGPVGAPST
jgi:hypothetical protein